MQSVATDGVAWSVGRSVTLVSPAKTDEPIEMPFALRTGVGPGNHVLDGGPDPPMGRGNFEGKGASHCIVTLCSHLCKNDLTDQDTMWVVGGDGPKESYARWGSRSPHGKGQFWGKGAPIVKYRVTLRSPVQKQWNKS